MADDLIDEWKQMAPAPSRAPARSAPAPAAEDLIGEWRKTLPPSLAPVAAGETPPDEAPPRRHGLSEYINRLARESRGHGTPSLTDLVTGRRPDSWGDVAGRSFAGAVRGIGDFSDTLAQGIMGASDVGAHALAARGWIDPQTAEKISRQRADVNASIDYDRRQWEAARAGPAGELSRIGGQILATGPVLRTGGAALEALPGIATATQALGRIPLGLPAVRGAATGATANVLTSSASDTPVMEQAGWGAGVGAALGPIGAGLGRLVGGVVDRETADLARLARDKYAIPVRVDQISGNEMVRRAGVLAQKTPGTGLAANVAEQQSAFNRAVANTFGETSDKITPNVMAAAKSRIGNVFETTLPKLEAYLNPKVAQRLQDIADKTDYLVPDEARVVSKHIDDILRQFTGVGRPGAAPRLTQKGVAKADGKEIQALIASGSPLDRSIQGGSSNVKYFASQLKDLLLDAVGQTPTGRAKKAAAYVQKLQDFQKARFHYKNMKTVEDLAEKSPTGDMSPALLLGQVRQSFGNMAYGGGGDLAELARIGQRFIKPPPTSGTAENLALMKMGALGVGAAGVAALDPEHFQRDAALALLALGSARAGGAALKAGWPARAAIRSGQRGAPPLIGPALSSGLPYLAPRSNPFFGPTPSGALLPAP